MNLVLINNGNSSRCYCVLSKPNIRNPIAFKVKSINLSNLINYLHLLKIDNMLIIKGSYLLKILFKVSNIEKDFNLRFSII